MAVRRRQAHRNTRSFRAPAMPMGPDGAGRLPGVAAFPFD
jgi:hypothetical protein